MQFISPLPFSEAVDKLGAKTLIASGLDSDQWSRVPLDLRERAFWSSQIESVRWLQRRRDHIGDFLSSAVEEITMPDGTKTTALKVGSRADFIKLAQDDAIASGMGPLDPSHAGTIKDIRTEKRLGLIFNTQVRQAQDYGWWQQGQDPDILNAYPAQRFIRERAVKEPRDIHTLHEGEVQLKTNIGFWSALNRDFGVPWGPWGWGCGHDVEDVDRADAERKGLIAPGQQLQPVQKDFNDRLEASTANLDPDMVQHLKDSFGDQVKIEDGTARWTAQPKPVPSVPSLPAAPEPIPARQSPVSAQVLNQATGASRKSIDHALEQIDRVHDDGKLQSTPITDHKVPRSCLGAYNGVRIAIRRDGIHPELTTAHEIGHCLDDQALPGSGYSSERAPEMELWRQAIQRSAAFQSLKARGKSKYRRYLLTWRELWARSYAQFIAARSEDKIMQKQLQDIIDGQTTGWADSHWKDDDFAPIAAEIETLFKNLSWL
jgi:hypothetical protein